MAADNVQSGAAVGSGPIFRTLSDGTNEWCVSAPAFVTGGSAGAWTLQVVDATHGLPVAVVGTVPVSASALPLPAGAATAANQATEIADLAAIAASLAGTLTTVVSGTVAVSNFPVTQTVSGTVAVTGTFWQATQPVSIATLPALAAGTAVIGHVIVDSGSIAVTGTFWQATQPVSIASLPALAAGSAVIGHVIVDSGSIAVTGTFWQATQPVSGTFWQATQPVSIAALPALAAGSAVIGHVIVDSGAVTVSGTVTSNPAAAATGGATTQAIISAGSDNAQNIKNAAGTVYKYRVTNFNTGYGIFVKLYNKASAPAPASDNALILDVIYVPAATSATQGSVVTSNGPIVGDVYSSGISLAIVKNLSATDDTAVLANDVLVQISWK